MKSIIFCGVLLLSMFYSIAQTDVEKKVALYREIGIANYWNLILVMPLQSLRMLLKTRHKIMKHFFTEDYVMVI